MDPETELALEQDEDYHPSQDTAQARARPSSGGASDTPETAEETKAKFQKLDSLLSKTQMYSTFLIKKLPEVHQHNNTAIDAKVVESRAADLNKLGKISGELRDYQVQGVDWLSALFENGLNGILADEMGLGKTIQVISFIAHLRHVGVAGPFLVIAPLSTLSNWVREFEKWIPGINVQRYHGTKQERAEKREDWTQTVRAQVPIVVTSFEIAMRDAKFFKKVQWKEMIVDEGHRLKNHNCKLIQILKAFPTDNRLLLTGTPLQNNLSELWSLMNFLLPTVFDSLERFQSWFDFDEKSLENSEGVMHVLQQEQEHSVITKLHEILRPFVLRRVKSEVLVDLPGKKEFIVYTQLQPLQEEYYTKLLKKELDVRNDTGGSLQNMLMQLRKVCNHPYLIQEPVDPVTGELVTDDRIISSCGKLTLLDRMLPRLLAEKHKILIFSQMRKVLDILDDYLVYKGLEGQYCRIDGMVPQDERQQQIDRFQEDPECVVFLLSTRAGGLGINLTAADTVIIYDSDWNPHQDSQAQDRCHRYGQKNEVRVYRFITPDTIEINMLARATSKRKLEEIVITEAKLDDRTHNKTIGSGTQLKTVSTKKSKLARALLSIFETSKDEDAKVPTSADPVVNDARKAQTGQESFSEQHMLTLLDRTPTGKDAAPAELLVVPGLFREVRAGASAIGGIQ